jgi:hypothetical protein
LTLDGLGPNRAETVPTSRSDPRYFREVPVGRAVLEAGERLSPAGPSAAGRGAALGGRPIGGAALGQGSIDIPAGKLHMSLDDAVDAPLPLEREVDPNLSEERAGRPGEVVRVAREAIAGGLAGGEDSTPVRAAARHLDYVGGEFAVDRSAELIHGGGV